MSGRATPERAAAGIAATGNVRYVILSFSTSLVKRVTTCSTAWTAAIPLGEAASRRFTHRRHPPGRSGVSPLHTPPPSSPLGEAASRRFTRTAAIPLGEAASRRFIRTAAISPLGEAASRRFTHRRHHPWGKRRLAASSGGASPRGLASAELSLREPALGLLRPCFARLLATLVGQPDAFGAGESRAGRSRPPLALACFTGSHPERPRGGSQGRRGGSRGSG